MGPHSSIGGARQIQLRGPGGEGGGGACLGTSLGPGGGASLRPEAPRGASNSLAMALKSAMAMEVHT